MRKVIVFLMCACFATSVMATEPTCEDHGGTTITANNGTTFCKSDKGMNWWSAFTWCESQGRSLAEFSKMCGNVSQSPSNTEGDCPNLQGKGDAWVWSSLAYDSYAAIIVNLSSGALFAYGRHDGGTGHPCALCE